MAPQPISTSTPPRTQAAPPPPPPPPAKPSAPGAPAAPKGYDTADKFEPAAASASKPKAEVWGPRAADVKAGKSVLAPNTRGPAIESLQKDLSAAGYDVPVDGKYDAKTKAAVESYQKAHGIKTGSQCPPGWTDKATLETLEADVKARRDLAGKMPKGSDDRKTMVTLMRSEGFNTLDNAERERLMKTLGGSDANSAKARAELKADLLDQGYTGFKGDSQRDLLRTVIKENDDVPGNVVDRPGQFSGKPADFTSTKTKDIPGFETHEMKVGDQTIEITRSTKGDDKTPTVEEVEKAIAAMPEQERKRIKSVMITGTNHNDGDKVRAAYDDKNGMVGIFNHPGNRDVPDLAGTLTHEAGHGAAAEKLGAEGSPQWTAWKDAAAKDGIPPSQYATKNAGEDFAETYRLYRSVKGQPEYAEVKARYPARFKMLEDLGE